MLTNAIKEWAHVLMAAALGLGLATTSIGPARAQGVAEPPVPPVTGEAAAGRLERVWLRQQRALNRLEFMFDHAQQRLDRAQEWIDRAKENGKDVAAIQAALDELAAALEDARPVFDSAQALMASHKGFDANGNVIDADLARQTVDAMDSKLREIRNILLHPGRALGDAIRAFRDANRPR
jgi:hypothetical protein